MAWISVDQKLIGKKLRQLYKAIGCSQNEAIGILISLWLWGIDNADADGLLVSADFEDIESSFSSGLADGIAGKTVVEKLIETGWIDFTGGQYFLHDWEEWRFYYNRYMREKKSNQERQNRYKARKRENAESNVNDNVTNDVQSEETVPADDPQEPKKQESKYGVDFEDFWKSYPRKVDKGQAYKKYSARRKDGFSAEELKAAAENYRKQCERQKTEQQYIKHAKTFLGESLSFAEYIPKSQEQEISQSAGGNPFRRNGG